jgi:hypothetical protein
MRQWYVYSHGGFVGTIEAKTKGAALSKAQQGRYREFDALTVRDNPGRVNKRMTKAQRRAKAKRAGSKRRKANAVKAFLKKMNPASKVPAAVKVTKLKGGGFTVKPIKKNFGRLRRIVRRVTRRRARR